MKGVRDTVVGYTGGKKEWPNYNDIGDHTEALQVHYDPGTISYENVIEVFWNSHQPTSRTGSCQYKKVLWYENEKQQAAAEKSRDHMEKLLG